MTLFKCFLTSKSFLWTEIVIQLSVENAMANRAAATKLKIVANARVTALQKPMIFYYIIIT